MYIFVISVICNLVTVQDVSKVMVPDYAATISIYDVVDDAIY